MGQFPSSSNRIHRVPCLPPVRTLEATETAGDEAKATMDSATIGVSESLLVEVTPVGVIGTVSSLAMGASTPQAPTAASPIGQVEGRDGRDGEQNRTSSSISLNPSSTPVPPTDLDMTIPHPVPPEEEEEEEACTGDDHQAEADADVEEGTADVGEEEEEEEDEEEEEEQEADLTYELIALLRQIRPSLSTEFLSHMLQSDPNWVRALHRHSRLISHRIQHESDTPGPMRQRPNGFCYECQRMFPVSAESIQSGVVCCAVCNGSFVELVQEQRTNWISPESDLGRMFSFENDFDNAISQSLDAKPTQGKPAPKSLVDNLPVIFVDEIQREHNPTCVVCSEDFLIQEEVNSLPCSHIFHGHCIKPWLERQNNCPVCRSELKDDGVEAPVDLMADPIHARYSFRANFETVSNGFVEEATDDAIPEDSNQSDLPISESTAEDDSDLEMDAEDWRHAAADYDWNRRRGDSAVESSRESDIRINNHSRDFLLSALARQLDSSDDEPDSDSDQGSESSQASNDTLDEEAESQIYGDLIHGRAALYLNSRYLAHDESNDEDAEIIHETLIDQQRAGIESAMVLGSQDDLTSEQWLSRWRASTPSSSLSSLDESSEPIPDADTESGDNPQHCATELIEIEPQQQPSSVRKSVQQIDSNEFISTPRFHQRRLSRYMIRDASRSSHSTLRGSSNSSSPSLTPSPPAKTESLPETPDSHLMYSTNRFIPSPLSSHTRLPALCSKGPSSVFDSISSDSTVTRLSAELIPEPTSPTRIRSSMNYRSMSTMETPRMNRFRIRSQTLPHRPTPTTAATAADRPRPLAVVDSQLTPHRISSSETGSRFPALSRRALRS